VEQFTIHHDISRNFVRLFSIKDESNAALAFAANREANIKAVSVN
jgi:hypothetical protein